MSSQRSKRDNHSDKKSQNILEEEKEKSSILLDEEINIDLDLNSVNDPSADLVYPGCLI